jgi:hypothetical protein
MLGPDTQAVTRRAAADPVLDPIEGGDPIQRRAGEWGLGCLMHIPELAPRVGHAGGLDHAAVAIEAGIPGISVSLQDTLEVPQMLPWVLPLAVRRIPIERRRRSRPGEWPIVANVEPAPAEAGIQSRAVRVLPRPGSSTGTTVSSACTRWPAITCRASTSTSGRTSRAV